MKTSTPQRPARVERQLGTVKSVLPDKGFGFITSPDGDGEYFFHRTSCTGVKFGALTPGMRVSFVAQSSAKGPRAEEIGL